VDGIIVLSSIGMLDKLSIIVKLDGREKGSCCFSCSFSKENEQEKQHEPFSRPSSFKIIESLSNIPIDERTIIPSTDFIPPRPSTEYLQPR
jgi:hypothetical protein